MKVFVLHRGLFEPLNQGCPSPPESPYPASNTPDSNNQLISTLCRSLITMLIIWISCGGGGRCLKHAEQRPLSTGKKLDQRFETPSLPLATLLSCVLFFLTRHPYFTHLVPAILTDFSRNAYCVLGLLIQRICQMKIVSLQRWPFLTNQ